MQSKIGPCPKQWNLPKNIDWLEQNPIVNPVHVTFLKDVVHSQREIADTARKEENV
jgi:hypothetical protein